MMRPTVALTLSTMLLGALLGSGCGSDSGASSGPPTHDRPSARSHATVAPRGALYAYRIPPGFEKGDRTGAKGQSESRSIETSVIRRPSGGISLTQTTLPFNFGSGAERQRLLRLGNLSFRRGARAHTGATLTPTSTLRIDGRPAVQETLTGARSGPYQALDVKRTTLFASGSHTIDVNCFWKRTWAARRVIQRGCDALLNSLRIKQPQIYRAGQI